MTNPKPRLSVGLALDQVSEQCSRVRATNALLDFQRRERNRVIQNALEYIPVSQMMKVTGMSRDTLYKIKNSPKD